MNNSDPLLNPEGGGGVWRADIEPALDNLMMRILERDNVQRAWKRVKSNKGAPGSDGMTLEPIRKPGICERLIGSEFWSQRADVLHRDRPQIPTAR